MSQVIDKKLFAAIDQLNDQQKQEVLVFVGHFLDESETKYEKWKDENFLAEMDNRYEYTSVLML